MTDLDLTRSPDRAGYAIGRLEFSASAHETILAYLESGRVDAAHHVASLALNLDKQAIKKLDEGRKAVEARIVGARMREEAA